MLIDRQGERQLEGVFSGFFLRFGFAAGKIELR